MTRIRSASGGARPRLPARQTGPARRPTGHAAAVAFRAQAAAAFRALACAVEQGRRRRRTLVVRCGGGEEQGRRWRWALVRCSGGRWQVKERRREEMDARKERDRRRRRALVEQLETNRCVAREGDVTRERDVAMKGT